MPSRRSTLHSMTGLCKFPALVHVIIVNPAYRDRKGTATEGTMRSKIVSLVGFGVISALAASPALAGTAPVPEPEVAGGLIALGVLAVGYRALRRRFTR